MQPDIVLVVEDEEESRNFLIEILEIEGFECIGVANGDEAFDYLRRAGPPCLIILDVLMPVMDGRQFRAAQLNDPSLANIPVVVVTALDLSAVKSMAPLGAFRKPVDVDALLQVVRQNC